MIVMDPEKILQFLLVLSLYSVKIEIFKAFYIHFRIKRERRNTV